MPDKHILERLENWLIFHGFIDKSDNQVLETSFSFNYRIFKHSQKDIDVGDQ